MAQLAASLSQAGPYNPVVLQLKCGSCHTLHSGRQMIEERKTDTEMPLTSSICYIAVVLSAVSGLLERKEYVCPVCKSLQSFQLDPKTESMILTQATMNVLRIRQWAQHQELVRVRTVA